MRYSRYRTAGRRWALLLSISLLLVVLGLSLGAIVGLCADPPQPDPSGIQTGSGSDLAGITPGTLTTDDFDARRQHGAIRGEAGGHGQPEPSGDQLHLDAGRWLPGHVHAGGLRAGRDGLHPRQERWPHHDHELHDLRAGPDRLFHLRLCLPGGRRRPGRCAQPGRPGRPQPRAHDPAGRHRLGPDRLEGLLPVRRHVRRRRRRHVPVPDGVHGHHRHDSDWRDGRTLEVVGVLCLRLLHLGHRLPDLRQLGLGRRLAQPARQGRPRRRATWTSPARASCTPSAAGRPWRARWCSDLGSANTTRMAQSIRSAATIWFSVCWAASSSPSAGSGSTLARRWALLAMATCASAWSPSRPCWRRLRARSWPWRTPGSSTRSPIRP